ncbi:FecR domain-containing protein [Bordetella ansorpii]|nr:FecR domain-containing protein [Bordetella ansorpii]
MTEARGADQVAASTGSRIRGGVQPLSEQVRQQAISWYVRMASGTQSAQDEQAFDQWHQAHPDHARAWRYMQEMGGRLRNGAQMLTPGVAHVTLQRAATAGGRRRALKALALVGAGGTAWYLVQQPALRHMPFGYLLADVRTGKGEQRTLTLEDGTRVMLNTASAIDVRFDARQRRILLHAGEILLTTGRDAAGRPFEVVTAEGTLTPVGTRFVVRHEAGEGADASTTLAVIEGAVDVRPHDGPAASARVQAGQQLRFTRGGMAPQSAVDEASLAWMDGTFVAEGMRLDQFLAQLSHYRPGVLRWSDEVAGLRITGSWPLRGEHATDAILESMQRRLPVKVSRMTRYWVSVGPR